MRHFIDRVPRSQILLTVNPKKLPLTPILTIHLVLRCFQMSNLNLKIIKDLIIKHNDFPKTIKGSPFSPLLQP